MLKGNWGTLFAECYACSTLIPKNPNYKIASPLIQIHVPYEQLRFRKDPHCAWSIQQDVVQVLPRWKNIPFELLLDTYDQGAKRRIY